jgi:beta-lactamase regulating signal transducer with metallopeptidase domain
MIALIDMLIRATALSAVAACGLALLPKAAVRLRLNVALGGLLAWLVPWPWIRVPLPLPSTLDASLAPLDGVLTALDPGAAIASSTHLYAWIAGAVIAFGALCYLRDLAALRAAIAAWRARSSSGERLRALLPAELRSTRAAIRVVAESRVAAAAGWPRSTIWIGDGFNEADLRVALVHECWHVRRRDPLLMAAVLLVRRLYWWNPLVAHLAGQALLLVEAACDRRCVKSLGAPSYIERLAAMMLDTRGSVSPRLAAAVRGHENVLRLELLSASERWRARDGAMLAALCVLGAGIALWRVAAPPPPPSGADAPAWSRVAIPDTPAGKALTALLDLDAWSSGVELVDIVHNEPLEIEYVIENRVDDTRRLGRLEVADGPGLRVVSSAIRDLGAETH